jgi:hypothetical protein
VVPGHLQEVLIPHAGDTGGRGGIDAVTEREEGIRSHD